jgi:hypothetical protein
VLDIAGLVTVVPGVVTAVGVTRVVRELTVRRVAKTATEGATARIRRDGRAALELLLAPRRRRADGTPPSGTAPGRAPSDESDGTVECHGRCHTRFSSSKRLA